MALTDNSYANLPYIFVQPMMRTNFGGWDTQYTIPEINTQSTTPSIWLNYLAQQQFQGNPFNNTNLFSIPKFDMGAYLLNLFKPIANNMANESISNCTNNIANAKDALEKMLKKEGITDDEKKSINELLDKLKEQEEKLKEITNNTSKLTPEEARNKAEEIESAVKDIITEINKLGAASTDNTTDDKKNTDNTDNDDEKVKKGTDTSDKTGQAKMKNNVGKTTETDDDGSTQGASKLNLSDEIEEKLLAFEDAIDYFWGTKNEQLNAVMENINSENVMDYMTGWNKLYAGSHDGNSFMKAFVGDAGHSQKKTYCKRVALALRLKAEELGIYDDCKEDLDEINKELKCWIIDDKIATNFDKIIKNIADKMGGDYKKYAEPEKTKKK